MEVRQPNLSIQDTASQRCIRILGCSLLVCAWIPVSLFGNSQPTESHQESAPPAAVSGDAPHETHDPAPTKSGSGHQLSQPESHRAATSDGWAVPDQWTPVNPISAGTPSFVHFPSALFGGAHHFGGLAQAADDRIYVVAGHRLLVGTGDRWRPVHGVPDEDVNSLFLAADERLYLSLENDFGFTRLGQHGATGWESIADLLPAVWTKDAQWKPIHEDAAGYIYFVGGSHVFAHHPENAMRRWRDIYGVEHVFSLHGEIHALTAKRDIYRLEPNGKVEAVLRDLPPDYADIHASVPWDADHQLFATKAGGLFLFDGKRFSPFELKGIDGATFAPKQLLRLEKDRFLAIDHAQGMLIFRADGTVLRQVHQIGGLKARIARAFTVDRDGWIWLAHTSGLYRINPHSSKTAFDHHQGLEGRVLCMVEHLQRFYVGTKNGLFIWSEPQADEAGHFEPIPNIPAVYSLVSTAHGLAAGTQRGLWIVDERGNHLVDRERYPLLLQSPSAPGILLAPSDGGIRSFTHNGFRWVPVRKAPVLPTSGLAVAVGPHGELWGEYGPGRIARYDFDPEHSQPVVYTPKQGLPLTTIIPLTVGDEMLFQSDDSLYRYLPARDRFMRIEGWKPQEHRIGHVPVDKALLSPENTLWVAPSDLDRHYNEFPPTHFKHAWPDIMRFGEDPITAVFSDSIGYLWIGNSNGLQRYRPHAGASTPAPKSQTLIHRVSTTDAHHALMDSSTGVTGLTLGTFATPERLLRFEFSLLDFGQPGGTTYATFLEGFDDDWQPFTPESARSVTALPPGDYTLHIQGRNRHGDEATPATIQFSIPLSPYQTWWARVLYGLGAVGTAAFLVFFLQRRLSAKTKKLKQSLEEKDTLITEHETELESRQDQLKSALDRAGKLTAQTDELLHGRARFKADLDTALRPTMANISQLSQLLGAESLGKATGHLLEGLRQAGDQLVGAVRERLDLRQLDLDQLPIENAPFNLRDPLERALSSIAPAAKAKGIDLNYTLEADMPLRRTGDATRVEQILSHLIATAIERSPAADVTVAIKPREEDLPDVLEFTVIDQGAGYDKEERNDILAQNDPQHPHRYRGTPQGVAIARHLIGALGGDYELVSQPGEGTRARFHLTLPVHPHPQGSHPPAFAEKRVLIIQDNPTTLDGLELLAEQHGLLTRLANDGPQALTALKEEPHAQIVWIDAELGDTPGHELLAKIRAESIGAKLPTVILADYANDPELIELAKDPHTLVVSKPTQHATLIAASTALLSLEAAEEAAAPEVIETSGEENESDSESGEQEEEDPIETKIRAALAKSGSEPGQPGGDEYAAGGKSTAPASSLRILLIDAHTIRAKSTRVLLQQCGYDAHIVQNLTEATGALEASDRDLVLLAHPLAGATLERAVVQLKQSVQGDAPPIFAAISPENDEAARKAGLDAHLRSPLDPIALQRLLRMVNPTKEAVEATN